MLSANSDSTDITIEELLEQFCRGSARKRRSLISSVEKRADEISSLGLSVLSPFDPSGDDWAAGWLLQVLKRHQPESLTKMLSSTQNGGWFDVPSEANIDFAPMQLALLSENFEEADRLTSSFLRELAGKEAEERGYVYFSEVAYISGCDLTTIDRLWHAYSQGRFSFSVQARILESVGGRFDRLWSKIGWKKDGVWTRYPNSFTWSLEAPEGHMPLINQLRGVRLMDAVLNHPALLKRRSK